ncbi:hypothetical protein Pmani_016721 [Petrolisthes manimaculis]|uniref:Uncharacterized protein n=1 Tax=Petrolisthes manimaculis TaxID=1843537 RepID=A0AAE1U6F1_9EUCA|nr:hypothetical protein Pmani_016721 [Petrolisthes manimaculis]
MKVSLEQPPLLLSRTPTSLSSPQLWSWPQLQTVTNEVAIPASLVLLAASFCHGCVLALEGGERDIVIVFHEEGRRETQDMWEEAVEIDITERRKVRDAKEVKDDQ